MHRSVDRPTSALDLLVTSVPDHNDGVATLRIALRLQMYLRDERTGGIDYTQITCPRRVDHRSRDAMRAEHRDSPGGNIGDVFDEHGAASRKVGNDVPVVDDLMENIDRRSVHLERTLGNLDRPRHPRAKAAGLGEQYIHHRRSSCRKTLGAPQRPPPDDKGCVSAATTGFVDAAVAPSVDSAGAIAGSITTGLVPCNSG